MLPMCCFLWPWRAFRLLQINVALSYYHVHRNHILYDQQMDHIWYHFPLRIAYSATSQFSVGYGSHWQLWWNQWAVMDSSTWGWSHWRLPAGHRLILTVSFQAIALFLLPDVASQHLNQRTLNPITLKFGRCLSKNAAMQLDKFQIDLNIL